MLLAHHAFSIVRQTRRDASTKANKLSNENLTLFASSSEEKAKWMDQVHSFVEVHKNIL